MVQYIHFYLNITHSLIINIFTAVKVKFTKFILEVQCTNLKYYTFLNHHIYPSKSYYLVKMAISHCCKNYLHDQSRISYFSNHVLLIAFFLQMHIYVLQLFLIKRLDNLHCGSGNQQN